MKVTSAVLVPSSTDVASMVNCVAELTPYCALVPVTEQEDPVTGAVTSIHEPELEDICALPDFTAQVAWFVVPFATLAKMRRIEFGITLKPYGGCPMLIDTAGGVAGGGVAGGGVPGGGVAGGGVPGGGVPGGGSPGGGVPGGGVPGGGSVETEFTTSDKTLDAPAE